MADIADVYKDFRVFLKRVWSFLDLPDPTPVQYDIAEWIQHGPRRSITEAFRGVGKSWITSAYVVWYLVQDPDQKVLVLSASKERSDAFSVFVKRLISEMPELRFLEPAPNQRSSNIAFDVGPAAPAHAPSVKSVGITGQVTGSRANLIVMDDVEVLNNVYTIQRRERLWEQVKELDAVLSPGGLIRVLGTPQTEESLYNELQKRGYVARVWPSRYPSNTDVYRGTLAPKIQAKLEELPDRVGTPTDPIRFDDVDLSEREASYGRTGFALQFMLDTSLSDALKFPLKCADFIVHPVDNEMAPQKVVWANAERVEVESVGFAGDRFWKPMFVSNVFENYQDSVMAIDPSGRGADETAFCVQKFLNGAIWTRRIGGFKGGFEESTLKQLAFIARQEKVNMVLVESNFGDGMFSQLFLPYLQAAHPDCGLEEIRSTKQKELRIIDEVEPVLNQHRIIIPEELVREDLRVADEALNKSFFYQLTHLTKEKGCLRHDDRLDAFAMATGYWKERMLLDVDQQIEEVRQKRKEEELERFIEHATGNRVGGTWAERMLNPTRRH